MLIKVLQQQMAFAHFPIPTVLMLLVMFDMWRNGQPDLDGLGDMEIEPQPGVWERLKATLDPRYLWARLWDNSGPVW